jgi:uncharacterized protein (DUF427 family)
MQPGEQAYQDIAWEYAEPLPEAQKLPDTLCFYGKDVTLDVDGLIATYQ